MLDLEIRGNVGYLTIARPEVRNALGPEVVAKLTADGIADKPFVFPAFCPAAGNYNDRPFVGNR